MTEPDQTEELAAKNGRDRDWIPILLVISTCYLVLFLPFAAMLGAKPEVLGGAIAILATTLGGILGARAIRK